MVEGNASMYLGSPRMAEMVIGEHATLEEMGGARMHATVSGCGDYLVVAVADATYKALAVLLYLHRTRTHIPPQYQSVPPSPKPHPHIVSVPVTPGSHMPRLQNATRSGS